MNVGEIVVCRAISYLVAIDERSTVIPIAYYLRLVREIELLHCLLRWGFQLHLISKGALRQTCEGVEGS